MNETPPLPEQQAASGVPMPVSQPVFLKALRWSVVVTVALAVIFAGIGYAMSGLPGLYGGLLGAAGAGFFLGMTLGSMAFANKFHASDAYLPLFFAIVLGGWLLKLVIFIVAALLIRSQDWLDQQILFIAIIVGAVVSLVIDVLIIGKARIPTVATHD